MPNPIITPNVWAAGAIYNITQTNQLRIDVRLSDLGGTPAEIEISPPAGATIQVLRNPPNWTTAGVDILTAGIWVAGAVALGDWTVTVVPGSPHVVSVTNASGASPQGILRLVITGLNGGPISIGPGGGDLSIDRLIADPSITNAQVSSGAPVEELDAVSLSSTLTSTTRTNAAPVVPLAIAPPVVGQWAPAAANAVAVKSFSSAGATATFNAPALYSPVALSFVISAALDLASNGTIEAGDPVNTLPLNVPISTVQHRMVLVLDRSGSMGETLGTGETKWDAAVHAAHAWIDLFRAFRPGNTHLAGIITFEHSGCSWTPTPAGQITLRNPANGAAAPALSALDTFADVANLNLGAVQTCTPIGDALIKALEVIEVGDPAGSKGTIVLLTDGYENSGSTTLGNASPPGAPGVQTLAARRASWPGAGDDLVANRILALAVGSTVNADLLNDLGATYYHLTNDLAALVPAFTDMIGEVLDAEQAMPVVGLTDPGAPPHSVYFQLPAHEQRVAFLVPWDNVTDEIRVGFRPAGSVAAFTLVATPNPAVVLSEQRAGHGIVAVDLAALIGGPVTGTEWRVQHIAGGIAQPLTELDVVAVRDLHTRAEITFDRRQYFIGEPIRLTCSIRSGGVPVTNATVRVDIAKPGEGLGTFLATNAGKIKRRPEGDDVGHSGGGADPDQGKGLMFKTLLRLEGVDDLPVVDIPDLVLFDDGAHGDGAAGDGDYSNVFTDTDKEGTYSFRFRISGQLPDGSTFTRLFARSTWVGVRPDPEATVVAWQLGNIVSGFQVAVLTIRPQTASGELLGPFRSDVINFGLWNASLDGALVDRLDGSYEQTIRYRPGDTPVVVPEVYGTALDPTGPTIGGAGKDGCIGWLIRAIRAVVRWIKNLFT